MCEPGAVRQEREADVCVGAQETVSNYYRKITVGWIFVFCFFILSRVGRPRSLTLSPLLYCHSRATRGSSSAASRSMLSRLAPLGKARQVVK